MRSITCLAILFLYVSTTNAQRILTLEQSVAIAMENNYGMLKSHQNMRTAEANLEAAKDSFKSYANLHLETPSFYETVNEQFDWETQLPRWIQEGSTMFQGRFSITQPLPTSGNVTLSSVFYKRRLFSNLAGIEEKRSEYSNSLTLSFYQPIFTPNNIKLGLQRADLNHQLASYRHSKAERQLLYDITNAFYGLVRTARQVEIDVERVNQSRHSYELAKKKYEAGLIPEVEALQLEVDLALNEAQLSSDRANLERAEDFFKQTLGMNLADSVQVVTFIKYTPINVNFNNALRLGLENRLELRELNVQKELRELDVIDTERQSEFKGAISAFYNLDGKGDEFERAIDTDEFNKNRGVTLSFSMPLWDWGKNKAEVQAAEANLAEAEIELEEERQVVEKEIRDAVRRVREASHRAEILSVSVEVAQKSYEITQARFEAGAVTSERLLDTQVALAKAKKDDLDAQIDYLLAIADLKMATMSDEVVQ